jgi:hypothetical protein
LRHEGFVLGHAIDEDGFVVNAVKLVGDGAVDGNRDGTGREFGNHNADWSGCDDVSAVGLWQIERAAGIVIGLAAGIDHDGAIGQLRNGRADGRIHFLIAASDWLVVNTIVIKVGRATDLQGEETDG